MQLLGQALNAIQGKSVSRAFAFYDRSAFDFFTLSFADDGLQPSEPDDYWACYTRGAQPVPISFTDSIIPFGSIYSASINYGLASYQGEWITLGGLIAPATPPSEVLDFQYIGSIIESIYTNRIFLLTNERQLICPAYPAFNFTSEPVAMMSRFTEVEFSQKDFAWGAIVTMSGKAYLLYNTDDPFAPEWRPAAYENVTDANQFWICANGNLHNLLTGETFTGDYLACSTFRFVRLNRAKLTAA